MLAGIILAAGASSRMGRTKALLPCSDGRSFLATLAAKFIAAGLCPVVAVVRTGAEDVRAAVQRERLLLTFAQNADPERGQLSSLLVGIDALGGVDLEGVAVMPVDQPLVSEETMRRVVAAWRRSRAPIVRPARGGRHGHPVVFDSSVFGELRAADLREGARSVLRAHASEIVDVPADDDGAFEDVDTPEDYERLFGWRP